LLGNLPHEVPKSRSSTAQAASSPKGGKRGKGGDWQGDAGGGKARVAQEVDIVILAAAVSDYSVETPSRKKIKSDAREITVRLRRAPKIIDEIKRVQKGVFLVGFKAETDVPVRQLVALSRRKMAESGADLIVANDIGQDTKKSGTEQRLSR